ncbi:MAG: hypothetical protein WA991_03980 [Ornithinimicrobium sp.]
MASSTPRSSETKVALIEQDVKFIKDAVSRIEKHQGDNYVSRPELSGRFASIEKDVVLLQRIVYGLVAIILVAVATAAINTVVRS